MFHNQNCEYMFLVSGFKKLQKQLKLQRTNQPTKQKKIKGKCNNNKTIKTKTPN